MPDLIASALKSWLLLASGIVNITAGVSALVLVYRWNTRRK